MVGVKAELDLESRSKSSEDNSEVLDEEDLEYGSEEEDKQDEDS